VPSPAVTYSARYLDRDERYEIARLRGQTLPVRPADRGPPGPVPLGHQRELARNADPRTGATCPTGHHWPAAAAAPEAV